MDSFSFKLTLKPWKIYAPTFRSNFDDDLSEINNLKERLAALQNMKLRLEKEAARLSTSGSEPFTMSIGFLKDAIKFLEEEEESIIKVMRNFQKPSALCRVESNGLRNSSSLYSQHLQMVEMAVSRDKQRMTQSRREKANAVKGSRDAGSSSGSSNSVYSQHLQMIQKALSRYEGSMGRH